MELDEYARIAAVEDEHWWYRNTRALMGDLLAPWLGSGQRILDAGCGPGGNGAWLAGHGHVVALDLVAAGLQFVRVRRPELLPVQGSITALPFASASFDVVTAITVLYCVPDDGDSVAELARVVRPGGAILLMEPAFPSMRRAHDTVVHGVHRYRRRELAALAERVGLHVERATYAYSFLAPPALVLGLADRLRPRETTAAASDVERRTLDRVFAPLATWERRLLTRRTVPFGTSALVVATRPF